jgi:hypothetical protein
MKFKTIALALAAGISLAACSTVDDNEIGLKRVYGEIQDAPVRGMITYNPWSTDIITFDNQQTKVEQDAVVPTHDQQRAHIKSVTSVQLSRAGAAAMYRNVGPDWVNSIVPSIVKSIQQGVVGSQTAVGMIQRQAEVETAIKARLAERLAKRGIILADYQLTEVKFSDDYMAAVEQKATAVQLAEGAKNKTVEIREQGEQTKIRAEAEASAMRVRAEALQANQNLIEYERLNVQREAIRKWDGTVPSTVMGGGQNAGVPFVNVPLGK